MAIVVGIAPAIGGESAGTNIEGTPFVASASATVTHFGFPSNTAGSAVKAAVYRNYNIVATGSFASTVAGINYLELDSPLAVTEGETLMLRALSSLAGGLTYDNTSGPGFYETARPGTFEDYTFPATYDWSGGPSVANWQMYFCLLYFDADSAQIIHDGDSLSSNTSDGLYPEQIFNNYTGVWSYTKFGRSGYQSYQVLADWDDRAGSVALLPNVPNYYVEWSGHNDINNGRSAADIYADRLAIAAKSIAHGYSHTLMLTILASTAFSAAEEDVRVALNTLIMNGQSSGGYIAVPVHEITAMQTPSNTFFYQDGVHPTASGGAMVASCVTSTLRVQCKVAGCAMTESSSSYNTANSQLAARFKVPIDTYIKGMAVFSNGTGNDKVQAFRDSSGYPGASLGGVATSTPMAPGWNFFWFDSLASVSDNDDIWATAVSDSNPTITYYNLPGSAWKSRNVTYSTFALEDPASAGFGTTNTGQEIKYFFIGVNPPIIDSSSVASVSDGDPLTLYCRGLLDTQGTGKIELCDSATYPGTTLVEQTVTAWNNHVASLTVDATGLSGTVYAFATTSDGLVSEPFSITISSATTPEITGDLTVTSQSIEGAFVSVPSMSGSVEISSQTIEGNVVSLPVVSGDVSLSGISVTGEMVSVPSVSGFIDISSQNVDGTIASIPVVTGDASVSGIDSDGSIVSIVVISGSITISETGADGELYSVPVVSGSLEISGQTVTGLIDVLSDFPIISGALSVSSQGISGEMLSVPSISGSIELSGIASSGEIVSVPVVDGSLSVSAVSISGAFEVVDNTPTLTGEMTISAQTLIGDVVSIPVVDGSVNISGVSVNGLVSLAVISKDIYSAPIDVLIDSSSVSIFISKP